MSKLWIFGDSFSMPQPLDSEFVPWSVQLAANLGVESSNNYAMPGVSNDYIFYRLAESINETDEGDYIVIQTTNQHRQWFFKDPVLSNYCIRDIDKYISKEQATALKEYISHLQNDELDNVRFIQFRLALERIVTLIQHAKFLILPGFHLCHGVEGSLIQVCDEEFETLDDIPGYYNNNDGKDPRINHLSVNNHKILADKITKFFNTGELIDLTTGFEKHFLK